jgi:hypothetical protein
MKSFMILLFTKPYYGNQITKIRWAGHVARKEKKEFFNASHDIIMINLFPSEIHHKV